MSQYREIDDMTEPDQIPVDGSGLGTSERVGSRDKRANKEVESRTTEIMPGKLLLAPIAYLALIALTAYLFRNNTQGILWVSIPLAAIWFGALGGVVISLQGMFLYRLKWDKSYNLWHVSSGLIGAIYGTVSFLFLVVIMKAGTNGTKLDLSSPVFALGAFAIGYGQQHFHAMMEKVFTTLFSETKKPGDNTAEKKS